MSTLPQRLRERILAQGPMTFADFMEAALYDPRHGFYSRTPVGEHGDFVTSPHVSALFGALLSRQIGELWDLLGRPDPFDLIEVGAGGGTLAGQILAGVSPDLGRALRYVAVERSSSARGSLNATTNEAGPRVHVAAALEEAGAALEGCLIANELLDNLPFHRVKGTDHGLVELLVGVEDDRFVLTEGPPSSPEVVRRAPPLAPGEEAVVSMEAHAFIEKAAGLFRRGYLWVLDYGWESPGVHRDFVHGYRGQRVEEDVLADPGSRDITAGVDFAGVVRHAEHLGLQVWGPVTQRQALIAMGYREWDQQARARQVRATADRDGLEAMHIYSERNRAAQLVDPMGLGDFRVLCIGVGPVSDTPPLSMSGSSGPEGP